MLYPEPPPPLLGDLSGCAIAQKTTMQIFEIDPLEDPRWGAFVNIRPDASVFHRVEWLQALKNCYGYKPVVLTTTPPGAALQNGLVFCTIQSALTGSRFVSLPFSDTCEPLVNDVGETDAFIDHLTEKVDRHDWKYLELRPMHHSPTPRATFGVSTRYFLHIVDITRSEESLFRSFHKHSVQRKIRRASRESLRYESGSTDELLRHFYKLLIMTRRRQGLPPQPLKWFRTLLTCLGDKATIRVAFKDGIPLASILTMANKKNMIYKYGCSDSRYSNLGGTAMLFWNAIQEAKSSGIEQLDMGRSDMDNRGLIAYKEHWGGKRSTVSYWHYPGRTASSRSEMIIKRFRRVISIAPESALVMLGNALYKHIG